MSSPDLITPQTPVSRAKELLCRRFGVCQSTQRLNTTTPAARRALSVLTVG